MAESRKLRVPVEVVKRELVPGVVLTLDKNEAMTLAVIMARIAGNPHKSRRKHTDAILDALSEAGFRCYEDTHNDHDGEFGFKNNDAVERGEA